MKTIDLSGKMLGSGYPPLIIAELSGNHQQNLDLALAMVEAAAAAKVDAIKLQTYTPDSLTLDSDADDFLISDTDNLWRGERLYDLYARAATPYEWHKPLFVRAQELGLLAFSSPFDEAGVELLESLNVPCYKIASFELNHLPLIKAVARTGKPLIMSTGMATESEITEAVEVARENGCGDVILLKCTSHYPSDPVNANLATLADMSRRFECATGLSDHTRGIGVAVAAAAMGAVVIEKHFVLDRQAGGVDAEFSMQPDEMAQLVTEVKRASVARGQVSYGPSSEELPSLRYRRSIYVAKGIRRGEVFTQSNIAVVRPAMGLHPRHYETLLGRCASRDLDAGSAMLSEYVEGGLPDVTSQGSDE